MNDKMVKIMNEINLQQKKKINVRFSPYGTTTHETPGTYANLFYSILVKQYNVQISEKPDFLFYHESTDEHLQYDCIKIFYTGENVSPNFNLCDYAIGFDWLDFGDRYYRFPIYLNAIFYRPDELSQSAALDWTQPANLTKEELHSKTEFCSFVYSNYKGEKARYDLFNTLSTYKKVNAGGKYLNNVGGPVQNKLDFEMKHKFSIACENSSRSGYTTEKIIGSLMAKTIPIYWGDPDIGKQFNEKRFINCHNFNSFDEVLNRVKEIDNDDDLFLKIVNEPITIPEYDFESVRTGFDKFLLSIINQPMSLARRATIHPYRQEDMIKREKVATLYSKYRLFVMSIIAKIYQPFKQIPYLEKLKQSLYRR
jgi:alpha(1,3/1,4) fucosyltransferase